MTVDGQDIRVIGESGDSDVSLPVGDEISIGGGEVSLAGFQTKQPIPNDCPGPYGIVGEVPTVCGLEGCDPPQKDVVGVEKPCDGCLYLARAVSSLGTSSVYG